MGAGSVPDRPLTDGCLIGSYVVGGLIGQGGMAAVYRAHDRRLGRTVALKVLSPELNADEEFRQRFIRESQAAAWVDDPHIIPVFEAGEAGRYLFIAMRYVEGGDVRSLLQRQGSMSAASAAAIVSPVAAALDAAHAAGLVHRDVKPANMLLDARPGRPDHVYLSDFGLAVGMTEAARLTATGQFLGTVDYVAPEQASTDPVTGHADQYALACAAFEMLCGRPPFARNLPAATLLAHLSEPPPRLAGQVPGLPDEIDAVLARALAKSPADRYPSCGQFADALRRAAGIGAYDARWDGQSGRPVTVLADRLPLAGSPGPAGGAARHNATVTTAGRAAGPPTGPAGSVRRPGPRQRAARWPLISAAAAAAAVAVLGGLALQGRLLADTGTSGAGRTGGTTSAASSHPATRRNNAAPVSPPATPSRIESQPAAPDGGEWIAQLASVPLADGPARLQSVLTAVRAQVPQAQVLDSSQFASLRPGYWVIYAASAFADGTQALRYCAEHGRATSTQCIGRYLSHHAADYRYQCYPPVSEAAATCYRP